MTTPIDQNRAERIGRSHPCERCLEYSFKKLVVRPSTPSHRSALGAVWTVTRICGMAPPRPGEVTAATAPRAETSYLGDLENISLANIDIIADPQKNLSVIMKDGVIYKDD